MRMIHFTDPQNTEKNYDWHRDVKENHEILLEQCAKQQSSAENRIWHSVTEKEDGRRIENSNTVWGKIKRWLLAFVGRKRL